MDIRDVPVVGIGPGSQPTEEDDAVMEYISMPKGMNTYRQPEVPEAKAVEHLDGAHQTMQWLEQALSRAAKNGTSQTADISALDPENRELVNQILGEGEVSVRYNGDFTARVQEAVLAGVWRTHYLDGEGRVAHDLIEVTDVPQVARLPGRQQVAWESVTAGQDPPADVFNARPVLTEVREHWERHQPGDVAHVINLTLLPLSEAEIAWLDTALRAGPVDILSRGYGDCRITGAAAPGVWWVRYYNSMSKLILNTLEIVDVPQVARAAPEDIEDSRVRLLEIVEPYRKTGIWQT
ncbi:MAG: hydrogenase expression/formation C-terminal domain-containing protein [Pseudomonadota bacterium]|nr:hydrogenase expression/formation C-terminal domain-containing protein [Pseudomonadota bacterium]